MNLKAKRVGQMMILGLLSSTTAMAAENAAALNMLDPVVVTASRLLSPLSQVGSSVTVITRNDLQQQGVKTIGDALLFVPSIDVVKSGGPGQLVDTYVRGAESGRTLVMVNGMEINDAISPGRSVDFSHLSIDNVERIEVLRGPQSAVYGSGAMAGVVNIITRQGSKHWQGSLDISGGKYSSWNSAAELTGSSAGVAISLAASWEYSRGFSAAKRMEAVSEPVPDLAPNGTRLWTADLGLGYVLSEDWSTHASFRQGREDAQLDYFAGEAGDTLNFIKQSNQQTVHWDLAGRLFPAWRQTISAGLAQDDREFHDAPFPGVDNVSTYHGRNLNLDWRHQLDWINWNSVVAGVNYRQEQGRSQDPQYGSYFDEQSAHFTGVYLEDRIAQANAVLDISARWDVYDRYGTRFTCRLAPVYTWELTQTSVRGSWGTGFNAPSLYQLYSSYGNVNLTPEASAGWDMGVEQKIADAAKAGITYFQTEYVDQINYNFITSRYANLGQVQTKGWELFAAAMLFEDLSLRLGYSKLTANDLTNQDTQGPLPLERRADYKITLESGYTWQGIFFQASAQHNGPRWDKDSSYQRIVMPAYTLVNVRVAYAITAALELYVKITNLFDNDYSEVYGYSTARFAAMAGLKYRWK